MEMSKKQKKEALRAYKEKNKKNYYLSKEEVTELFQYLEEALEMVACDHTLKNTDNWLRENIDDEERCNHIRQEIKADGGYCDCEVLCNCYEEYDI